MTGILVNVAPVILLAYLIGAIPTSYLIAKYVAGIDLRHHGSNNLGATNLYRALGWKYAVPAGVFDLAKGFVPVVLLAPLAGDSDWIPIAVGLGAILGHVYPVYLKFVGGKGVATAAGVVLGIAPVVTMVSLMVWAITAWGTGFMSLASMAAAVAFPITVAMLLPDDTVLLLTGLSISVFIVFTHRTNIRRLLAGTESRFGRRGREA